MCLCAGSSLATRNLACGHLGDACLNSASCCGLVWASRLKCGLKQAGSWLARKCKALQQSC